MVKLILYALPFLAMFAPNMWVHYVFRKNDEHFSDMPFTAHEFGKKIIDEQELKEDNEKLSNLPFIPISTSVTFKSFKVFFDFKNFS